MKTVEEKLKSYEPLWENWTYSGEFLGEGAMSSVFEIQSTAMGLKEVAALKIITVKKDFRGEVKIPESALNEIKILRDLSSCPNIVHYHDSTQRQIFDSNNELAEIDILIKMEKLRPLSESDKLSETEVIRLAKDMCSALIHASEHGIIHRDIKPQNIFVDHEGTYKLGDFGIAKIVSDLSSGYTMNIGTLAYTAPEIHNNTTGRYDISADIYSLGMVLYVFLNNGCMPFVSVSPTLNDAISKRLSGVAFPSPANGSKNLKSIVMRACANDVARRYKTPAEMLEDLELLSTGGKRLVIDPFATLDANVDITEEIHSIKDLPDKAKITDAESAAGLHKVPVDLGKAAVSGSGSSKLRINLGSKTGEKSEPGDKEISTAEPVATGSKLRINLGSKAGDSSPAKTETVSPEEPITTGSKLRINLGSTNPNPNADAESNPASTPVTGGKLKINLGTKTNPPESDTKDGTKTLETETEKTSKKPADFFSTPPKL
ncbi:MAG: serine/threonine protein kinase [Clostridia bacterium]|nr:serine/threonine protein kinase [Clostridia bacterium]